MTVIDYVELSALQRPLLEKFYRSQRNAARMPAGAHLWVARHGEVIAGLCLTPVANGHWLTGLLVAQTHRGSGVATALIVTAAKSVGGIVWLFCHPHLQAFYARIGFAPCTELPESLADRLERYRRVKPLVAMVRYG